MPYAYRKLTDKEKEEAREFENLSPEEQARRRVQAQHEQEQWSGLLYVVLLFIAACGLGVFLAKIIS